MWGWFRKRRAQQVIKTQALAQEFDDIEERIRYVLAHQERGQVLSYDPVQGMSYSIVLNNPEAYKLLGYLETLLLLALQRGDVSSEWKRHHREPQAVALDDFLVAEGGYTVAEPEIRLALESRLTQIDRAFAACYKAQDESHVQYLLRYYTSVLYDSCEVLTALYRCRSAG